MGVYRMIWIKEVFINRTLNARFGDSGVIESHCDTPGEVYKACRAEYGRCVSKVYIDTKDGGTKSIGWVFLKRMKYEDARSNKPEDYYLREVWVVMYQGPAVTRTEHAPYVEVA